MKKILIIAIVLTVLLVVSNCDDKFYSVSITNDSSKTVSYVYDDNSDTLGIIKTNGEFC